MSPDEPRHVGADDQTAVAVADLARRLDVPATQVGVVLEEEVTWPDSSLGCPRPGMNYLQVLTPGRRILLEVGGDVYEYHSGGRRGPFLCAG